MKIKLLVLAVMMSLLFPPVSHGFGLFQWAMDAVCNTLGLDRGPAPLRVPKAPPPGAYAPGQPSTGGRTQPDIYIQAGGY